MPLKIVRQDITKMNTEAVVNAANENPVYKTGCDYAIYMAAGSEELLEYRREHIGYRPQGDVFITPGFNLPAKYIIHAVSPAFIDGESGEEEKLRDCYKKSLLLAYDNNIKSISFPLLSTGGFGYPKEDGMRIAVDEINHFLLSNDMEVYLVVFDTKSTQLGEKIYPALEAYINHNYVLEKREEEYGDRYFGSVRKGDEGYNDYSRERRELDARLAIKAEKSSSYAASFAMPCKEAVNPVEESAECVEEDELDFLEDYDVNEKKLKERMEHLADTFSQYLLYLIKNKGMDNVEVYKRAIVNKKMFSKIKNDPYYHPNKITALCLCVGAKLTLDETKDLLARAGYALSPCDKTDIIFSFFIENKIYDMIEIDIQLEEHGLACIIS